MVEQKEEVQASKILVDFVRDFSLLTEQQILSVRKMMEQTVSEVMEHVTTMASAASSSQDKANELLVRDESRNGEFVSSNRSVVESKETELLKVERNEEIRKAYLEGQLMRSGGVFTKHLEALSRLNVDLQTLVSRVIGAVSIDDVIAQRLSHVISSVQELQDELVPLIAHHKDYNTTDAVKMFRNKVLTKVYLSYTSEDEKEVFHKIFGHPKEVKRVS